MLFNESLNANTSSFLPNVNNRSISVITTIPNVSSFDRVHPQQDYDYDYNPLSFDGSNDHLFIVLRDIQKYFLPVMCTLGCFGNLASVAVFLTKSMRKKSYIVYLTTKCVMDTFFLLSLYILWLDRVNVTWFNETFVCQLVVFVTYMCSHMSAWMVVMVTVENYLHVGYPTKVKLLCKPRRARFLVLGILLLGLTVYHIPFWTTISGYIGDKYVCSTKDEYTTLYTVLTYVDTVLTLMIPSVLLFMFTIGIIHSLLVSKKGIACLRTHRQRERQSFYMSPITHITVMLLAVTISFIVLNTPSHAIRLRLIIQSLSTRNPNQFIPTLRMQRVFELLYYTSFSTNFLTYIFSGRLFRSTLKIRFSFCLSRGNQRVVNRAYPGRR